MNLILNIALPVLIASAVVSADSTSAFPTRLPPEPAAIVIATSAVPSVLITQKSRQSPIATPLTPATAKAAVGSVQVEAPAGSSSKIPVKT